VPPGFCLMKAKPFTLALAVVVLVVGAIYARGRGRPLADIEGQTRDLTVTPQGVFWISAPAEPGDSPARIMYVGAGGGTPSVLLQAYDVRSLAVHSGSLYALAETGPEDAGGVLVIRDLKTGQRQVHKGLHSPQGLYVDGSRLFWTESRASRAEAIAHVPIMCPLHALRVTDAAPAQGKLMSLMEGSDRHFAGQIVGLRDDKLYWTEPIGQAFSAGCTLVRRKAPSDMDPETMARTKGANVAALDGANLYWTAYSLELNRPSGGRVTYRRHVDTPDQELLTDWLPAMGALLTDRGGARFVGAGWLWEIPHRLAEPTPVRRFVARGPGTVALYRGSIYGVDLVQDTEKLVRRPLGLRGYILGALAFRQPAINTDTTVLGGDAA